MTKRNDTSKHAPNVYIYALIDPFTDAIRYIGKSIRPHERLVNQCNEKSNTHRCYWIQSVLAQGRRPIQIILQELAPDDDWQAAEKNWIAMARSLGCPLVNGTDGGDGVIGLTDESKERMAKTWVGRKHKPESLAKIGAASRQRKHTDEWRQLMHEKMKGRKFTDEHREKLKGSKTDEHRLNISKAQRIFTNQQIREIRQLLAQGVSQYRIADMYNTHQTTVSHIKLGKSYSDVL